jgi:hypothetical protein
MRIRESWLYGAWPVPAIVGAVVVLAVTQASGETAGLTGPQEAKVGAAEVIQRLEASGYGNVHDVEWDDGAWEIEATNPQGLSVDLKIDPATGEVLEETPD